MSTTPSELSANREQEICWLIDRLYETSRELQSSGACTTPPHFVLLTRGPDNRRQVEERLMQYFVKKFGWDKLMLHYSPEHQGDRCSVFHLPYVNAAIVLMDL